uniref:Notch n=1 Tax=Phallusia mammillata TaxID=59560 RepID=A0A6F9DMJ7_9ASCI|nr:Notch precursor [Phallusia mammillata]
MCSCTAKFTGERCEIHIPPCYSNPCLNGATCVNYQDYYMCICTPLYFGLNCDRKPTLTARSVVPPSWTPPYAFVYNVSYRRCYSGMALNVDAKFHGRSWNRMNATVLAIYPWGFQALIRRHNTKVPVKEYRLIHYRATFNTSNFKRNPCLNRGVCTNSAELGRVCECRPGYAGEFCEIRLNYCLTNPCFAGTCNELENGYSCTCKKGSTGQNCSVEYLSDVRVTSGEEWISNENNLTIVYDSCKKENASRVDVFVVGQVAALVEVKVLEIYNWGFNVLLTRHASKTIPWENIQVALNWTSYFDIRNGYLNVPVRDALNPCLNGGKCSNTYGGHICTCKTRYSGQYCETELPFCATNPCANGGICSNSTCHCAPGFRGPSCRSAVVHGTYRLQPEERFQTVLFEECFNKKTKEVTTEVLRSGKLAIGFSAYVLLLYNNGFKIQMDRPWSPHRRNYTGMEVKWAAVFVTSNFKTNVCKNEGRCTVLSENDVHCNCTQMYKGKHCQTKVYNCTPNLCQNGGQCVDTIKGYRCICKNGYKGVNCTLVSVNGTYVVPRPYGYSRFIRINVAYERCYNGPAKVIRAFATRQNRTHWRQKVKINEIHSWGFVGEYLREHYDFIQPTTTIHWEALFNEGDYQNEICRHGERCVNSLNGPVCTCMQGYLGPRCEQVDFCQSNPCLNGGSCLNDAHYDFLCECPEGFVGNRCSFDIVQWKTNFTNRH